MDFMENSLAYFSQGEAFCLDGMNDRRDLARLIELSFADFAQKN